MTGGPDIADGFRAVDDTWRPTGSAVRAQLEALLTAPTPADELPLRFTRPDGRSPLPGSWDLTFEDGGSVRVDGRLPPGLPLGIHQLQARTEERRLGLVVAPDRAPTPTGRTWGWWAHIPMVRRQGGRGIGDLGSLARLGDWARSTGAGTVATLPMHAPLPLEPREASPYFPSSRVWRDPLLIDPEMLGLDVPAGADRSDSPARDQIWRSTRPVLERAWRTSPDRARDRFERWRRDQGASLERFAMHEAIAEAHGTSWPSWPTDLQDPTSSAVAAFAREHRDLVGFHAWLQWQLDAQLTELTSRIALFADLAVGVRPDGADAWCYPGVLATGARVGAPPDVFNASGQDWGLAPFDPHALRAAGYAPFLDSLRATLRGAAGIRIDHIMGLFRLWWIPAGNRPADGAYVRMPADDLLDLVCLEATRARAHVVGEDLGTVEDTVRDTMGRRGLLGTRLVWFSDLPPSQLPTDCIAAISNHDLPTVRGLVEGHDAAERRALDLTVDAAEDGRLLERLSIAAREGGLTTDRPDAASSLDLTATTLHALSAGPAAIVLADVRDALGCADRVNVPGTDSERANWSEPLPIDVDDFADHPGLAACAAAITPDRHRTANGSRTPGVAAEEPSAGARSGT